MSNSKDKFLQRIFLYKLQYVAAFSIALLFSYGQLFIAGYLKYSQWEWSLPAMFVLFFPFFNTVTYFYSKFLVKKYGIEMFADLDQDWLREHQAFDSKAFGEIFARLIQCRKIAGPYMLCALIIAWVVHIAFTVFAGIIFIVVYFFYRQTYFDTAISYKIPRAMGGGGIVVSKIIDEEFTNKIDKLSEKLDQKDKK